MGVQHRWSSTPGVWQMAHAIRANDDEGNIAWGPTNTHQRAFCFYNDRWHQYRRDRPNNKSLHFGMYRHLSRDVISPPHSSHAYSSFLPLSYGTWERLRGFKVHYMIAVPVTLWKHNLEAILCTWHGEHIKHLKRKGEQVCSNIWIPCRPSAKGWESEPQCRHPPSA